MELTVGQIVASRAGRDSSRLYVVVGLEGERAMLANGGRWTLAQPKAKNLRHINKTRQLLDVRQMQTDTDIKRALAEYQAACGQSKKEE